MGEIFLLAFDVQLVHRLETHRGEGGFCLTVVFVHSLVSVSYLYDVRAKPDLRIRAR